jgi:negative regulator of sigma E activity
MTAGSDHVVPNRHAIHPRDDRETLSALFDGQLPGDAVRFALKRLDHDVRWREACGRWQLIGDALRGQATIVAPSDFALRVMRALDAESMSAATAEPGAGSAPSIAQTGIAPRRRWIGGAALAASVAMAAMLVVRPFSQDTTSSDPQVVVGAAATSTQQVVAARASSPIAPASASTVSTSTASAGVAAAAVAVASRPVAARRIGSNSRPAQRLSQQRSAPIELPSNTPATEVAAATPAASTHQPFHPSGDEITTRPWPRAVLPNASGTLTVGFGSVSTSSPSFYPFEPRLPASETQSADEPKH